MKSKEMIKRDIYLPATIEELNQFVLVHVEKLKAYRVKLHAVDRLELADGVRKQTLEEGHKVGSALLWAEAKLGEFLKEIDPKPGARTDKRPTHTKVGRLKELGISEIRKERLEKLATNQDLIEEVLAEAKENEDLPTRSEVLRKAKEREVKKTIQGLKKERPVIAGKYKTIIVDPPWFMEKISRNVSPEQVLFDYPTMKLDKIKNIEIPTDKEAHIYLWTTQKYLPFSFDILDHWGFNYIFTMVWHKNGGFQSFKLPQYNCEFVLFGKRGSLPFLETKNFFTCFDGKRREHSRKPDEFYDLVKRVSPGPRIDLFSREKREGFDQYGNESNKFKN